MRTPKAVLFDLGDTIIHQKAGDFLKGTKAILKHSNEKHDSVSIQAYAAKLDQEMKEVKEESHFEYSARAFMKFLYEYHNVKLSISLEEQEILFNRVAFDRFLAPNFKEFLSFLKAKDIPVAILSNTTFSENTLRDELSIYQLEDDFEFIIATADYGIRKPDYRIFHLATNKLKCKPEEVWYIGNSFKYDVIGAHNGGLFPLWYNHEKKKPLKDLDYHEFTDYKHLIKEMEDIL